MQARVSHIWRHPIKGHGVESVATTMLVAGATMPWDRVWAIADEAAKVTPGAADWAPCINFSRGAKSPELMAVRARVDEAREQVTLEHPRQAPITVDPDLPEDAARLVAWVTPLADLLSSEGVRERMGRAARVRALRSFDIAIAVDAYRSILGGLQ